MGQNPSRQATPTGDVAAALAGIRADFIDGLIPLINEVEFQSLALDTPGQVPQALASLQQVAHKVSGMAGSVGFPALGERAAQLDMTLAKMRRGPYNARDIATLHAPLEDLMDHMEAALDAPA